MSSHLQWYRKCRGRLKSQLTDPVKVDKDSKCMFDLCTAVLQILTLFLIQFFVFFIKGVQYFKVLVSDEKFLFSDFSVAWLHVRETNISASIFLILFIFMQRHDDKLCDSRFGHRQPSATVSSCIRTFLRHGKFRPRLDCIIHQINRYPADKYWGNRLLYQQAICTKRSCDIIFMKMKVYDFAFEKRLVGHLVFQTGTIFLK